ncbi:MAG: TIGR03643 family protein [Pontibacterium sp.]
MTAKDTLALPLTSEDLSRIVEMAWEDRTPFEAIENLYGIKEPQVRILMRKHMKASSFRMWRKRVSGRKTKHLQQRPEGILRAYAPGQYKR